MVVVKRLWAGLGAVLAMVLLAAGPATASTAQIQDDANVLNVTAVQNEAATLPVPVYVWTTTQDANSRSAFDTDVRNKVSAQFPIAIGINTQAHHATVQIGARAGLTQSQAVSAAQQANSAFDSTMRASKDYTNATVASLASLNSALANRAAGHNPNGYPAPRHRGHPLSGLISLAVIVAIIFVVIRIFTGRRRRRMPPPGYGPQGYGPPGYGPGYDPNQGYPPQGPQGYGPQGPGFGGRSGMSAGAAGGLGALGGGLLGYEMGRMSGENEQYRRDESGFGGGNDGGGQGDWVIGQDSDFGGDSGGGDSGGGDNSGGDW